MLKTLLMLFGVLLGAEIIRNVGGLPLPAPVIGLFLMALMLALKGDVDPQVADSGSSLIGHMGLLFVPAGVGIVAQFDLLQREWMPIAVALLGSTILGVAVTGAVMHWFLGPAPDAAPSHA